MNIALLKIVIALFSIVVSAYFNRKYLSVFFAKKKKIKFFNISTLICIIASVVILLLLDIFLYRNDVLNYVSNMLLVTFLLSITFEDIKTKTFDTHIIILFLILFVICRIICLNISDITEGFLGFVCSFLMLFIPHFIKKSLVGFGDVLVVASCGMILGFSNIFSFLFKTFLLVFIYGIYLFVRKKKNLLTELPLAPFLLAATII